MDAVLCKDHMLWTANGRRNQTQSILEFYGNSLYVSSGE